MDRALSFAKAGQCRSYSCDGYKYPLHSQTRSFHFSTLTTLLSLSPEEVAAWEEQTPSIGYCYLSSGLSNSPTFAHTRTIRTNGYVCSGEIGAQCVTVAFNCAYIHTHTGRRKRGPYLELSHLVPANGSVILSVPSPHSAALAFQLSGLELALPIQHSAFSLPCRLLHHKTRPLPAPSPSALLFVPCISSSPAQLIQHLAIPFLRTNVRHRQANPPLPSHYLYVYRARRHRHRQQSTVAPNIARGSGPHSVSYITHHFVARNVHHHHSAKLPPTLRIRPRSRDATTQSRRTTRVLVVGRARLYSPSSTISLAYADRRHTLR